MSENTGTYDYFTMDGLGNDFIVFDAREQDIPLSSEDVRLLSDRVDGIGCDQLIVIKPSDTCDAFMEIWNADGGMVAACGNAARCIAWYLADGKAGAQVSIQTAATLLHATVLEDNFVTVDMGEPGVHWQDIPLAGVMDTLSLPLSAGPLANPIAVSMGNPHAVFFVEDVDALDAIDLESLGPILERDALFPEHANISVCSVEGDLIRQRVWERGVGITKACGTGACAALVAAARRGLTGRIATVRLDGGDLTIIWNDINHVIMTGEVAMGHGGTVTL